MGEMQEIREPKRKYFTMMPNLYDDANLTPHEFRLLAHYCRVGNCYEGRRTTAKICRMSKDTVTKVRQSLADKGFITLEHREGDSSLITIVDVWRRNTTTYGGSNGGGLNQGQGGGQTGVTQGAKSGSGGGLNEGHKEEPNKNNKEEEAPTNFLGRFADD